MKPVPPLDARRRLALTFARFVPAMVRGAQLDFFAKRSITQSQMMVLLACFAHGKSSMSTLAKAMHVQLPTMTGFVERLVDAGYLRRRASDTDRRQVMIELTPRGLQFVEEHREIIARRFSEVAAQLTEKDVDDMQRILTKLLTQFGPAVMS